MTDWEQQDLPESEKRAMYEAELAAEALEFAPDSEPKQKYIVCTGLSSLAKDHNFAKFLREQVVRDMSKLVTLTSLLVNRVLIAICSGIYNHPDVDNFNTIKVS